MPPTGHHAATERATSPQVARTMERLMLARRARRHRRAGRDPGRERGGQDRHGGAEVHQALPARSRQPRVLPARAAGDDPKDTDAWFAAYAPAGNGHPRIAVGVLLVSQGAGGDTAAPVARDVLLAGLKRSKA